jgi:hypothetical protein
MIKVKTQGDKYASVRFKNITVHEPLTYHWELDVMRRRMHIVQLLVIPYGRVDVYTHSSRRGISVSAEYIYRQRGVPSAAVFKDSNSCLYSSAISIIPEPLIKYSYETKRLIQPWLSPHNTGFAYLGFPRGGQMSV